MHSFYQRGHKRTLVVDAFLLYLTEESTLFGMTFQHWIPLVAGIFIIWIGVLKSISDY
jgi:hypothetical protein